ncbi:MAG: HAMP domain-containing protein [Desulfobacteraceae bacterium]|nr:MAG: HAMP domain-containing protein [Desulfobacteraceae bacterium]
MKHRLLWKLLLISVVPVIAVIILVVWLAIDQLAADYFMTLMDKYDVSPTETHQMFLAAVHRYLVWATLAALAVALLLGYLLTRRVLRPMSQMAAITRQFAAGNFSGRVAVSSRDEIGQLGLAFNRMADSLEKLERLRKSMVADVAHELRTPLTNLRGYLEGLSDEVIPPSQGMFRMLLQEILRLVHLVEDLQQLAKADAAKAFLNRRPISLRALIEQLLALYRPQLEEKKIDVLYRFAPGGDHVSADPDKLLQALRNLIENAWKYSPLNGRITIETTPTAEGNGIRVSIANNGPAIAPEDLPFIFERFYRADRSRSREGGGAGIGLAIVKELINAHGGQVGAESRPDETCVWLTLPVAH